jgi:hypothetical protein
MTDRAIDLLFAGLAFWLPSHLWGLWWWACLILGLAFLVVAFFAIDWQTRSEKHATFARIRKDLGPALTLGIPVWALGFGGWPLSLGAAALVVVVRWLLGAAIGRARRVS